MKIRNTIEMNLRVFRFGIPFWIFLFLGHHNAFAQYYPAPKPVSPAKETQLLLSLKNSKPDAGRVSVLLELCNLHLNNPLRRNSDLDNAMKFGQAAVELSQKLHDAAGYNNAQLYIADVNATREDMQPAEDILKSLNDTAKINLLLNLSFKYWNREREKKDDDWRKALLFAGQAKEMSIRYHIPLKEILALKDIALVHADQEKPAAEAELLDVVKRYQAIKYPYLQYIYSHLADFYLAKGIPNKALKYCMLMLESMKTNRDTLAAGDFYNLYALVSINNDDFQKGLYYGNLSVNSYKIHPARMSMANRHVFSLVVRPLRKLKRYEEALRYIRKAMKDYPPENAADEVKYYFLMGNVYRDMKNYAEAGRLFEKAARASKNLGRMEYLESYFNLGQLYVESKQYAKSKPYLYEVWNKYGRQYFPSNGKSHMNYMLFLADSATGDYRSAMQHLADVRGPGEFTLRQQRDKEVKKLEVDYKNKEKASELKLRDQNITLLNQNNKIQEASIGQSDLVRDVAIGVTILIIVSIGVLFKHYRHTQRVNLIISKKNDVITEKNDLITEQNVLISSKNQQLEVLLLEKEWLLKEVHHRVKNNLERVMRLLESPAGYLESDALKALEKSQNRIYTMSLIHQKLYLSDDVQTIDMETYIPELVRYLKDSFGISDQILFRLKVDPVSLEPALAVPVALIINEALTNSIKYAFPDGRPGEIVISLRDREGTVKLEFSDNGIGMGKITTDPDAVSLGLELMKGLTKEIRGDISFKTTSGVRIIMLFKKEVLDHVKQQENGLIMSA